MNPEFKEGDLVRIVISARVRNTLPGWIFTDDSDVFLDETVSVEVVEPA
jgi:ribosomal protein L21E